MAQRILEKSEYTFNATAGTITFDAFYTGLELANILLISNITTDAILYTFTSGFGGTLAGLVLTLEQTTVETASDTDDLRISISAPWIPELVEGTITGGTGGLTDAELRATPVDVNITGGAGSGLTDAELRASPVEVDTGLTQPLTDAQLRASVVPVSTGLTQPLTDAQLRVTPVAVSGTFWQATQPISVVALPLPTGAATAANQQTDALTDAELRAAPVDVNITGGATTGLTDAELRATPVPVDTGLIQYTQGDFVVAPTVGTMPVFRKDSTGEIYDVSDVAGLPVNLLNQLRQYADGTDASVAGSIGNLMMWDKHGDNSDIVNVSAVNPLAVSIEGMGALGLATEVKQDTQITSLAAIKTAVELIDNAISGSEMQVDVLTMPTVAVTGTFWQATQPVSGTVTANAGTNLNTSALALESGGNLASINTKTPALGQALAAASVPVVLTAAQITTLTPPAAIAGFNLEATQLLVKAKTDNLDVALSTRLKPADTLTAVALNSDVRQAVAANLNVTEASALAIKTAVEKIDDVVFPTGSIGGTLKGIPALAVPVGSSDLVALQSDAFGGLYTNIKAGTAIIGKVGIDQTTPGTTNGVSLSHVGAATIATGNGAASTGVIRVSQVNNGTGVLAAVTEITNALPAGTNAIGKLAANSGVDIGDVDVLTLPAITIAAAQTLATVTTVSAVTAITNALPTGTNTLGSIKLTDGTDVALVTAAGEQNVLESNSAAIKTAVEAIDDAVATFGTSTYTEATTRGTIIAAVRRDADTTLVDTTNEIAPLQVNSVGALKVTEVKKATYRASTQAVLVAAVTVDRPFFTIYGSATKTIRVQSIIVSGLTLTAVAYLNIALRKYSTAVSGGTSTALTKIPVDSNSAASTATNVNAYTAIPTAGTLIGDISGRRVIGQATTAAAAGIPQVVDFDFSPTGDGTSIVLRGTGEGIGLAWAVAPASAVSMMVRVEWTEE